MTDDRVQVKTEESENKRQKRREQGRRGSLWVAGRENGSGPC